MPKFPLKAITKALTEHLLTQEDLGLLDDEGNLSDEKEPVFGMLEVFGEHLSPEAQDELKNPARTMRAAPREAMEREDVLEGMPISMPDEVPNG